MEFSSFKPSGRLHFTLKNLLSQAKHVVQISGCNSTNQVTIYVCVLRSLMSKEQKYRDDEGIVSDQKKEERV